MLPELQNIILEYRNEMNELENLPEISAVQRVIDRSNRRLKKIATEVASIPVEVVDAMLSWEDITLHPEYQFLVSEFGRSVLDDVLTMTLATDYNTNIVFWLFILRTPTIYTGPFGAMFEKSLVFKIINLVTITW